MTPFEKKKRRMLSLRACLRLMEHDEYDRAVAKATPPQLKQLDDIENPAELKLWIKDVLADPLTLWSQRALRDLASKYGVLNYSRMTKEELVEAVKDQYAESMARRRNTPQ